MDEVIQTIKEYAKIMPKNLRDEVASFGWRKTVDEISVKYSLTEEQNYSLFYSVLLVLIGIADDENLIEDLMEDLGISKLLAEQIKEELSVRILEVIAKKVEEKNNSANEQKDGEEFKDSYYIPISPEQEMAGESLDNPPDNLPTGEDIPLNFVDDKLNTVVVSKPKIEKVVEEKPSETLNNLPPQPSKENPMVKSYVSDPYREPTE